MRAKVVSGVRLIAPCCVAITTCHAAAGAVAGAGDDDADGEAAAVVTAEGMGIMAVMLSPDSSPRSCLMRKH